MPLVVSVGLANDSSTRSRFNHIGSPNLSAINVLLAAMIVCGSLE